MFDFKFPKSFVAIGRWIDNAKWYHIWNPGSGFAGGILVGAVLMLLTLVATV